jgi:hypothetical protein
VPDTLRNAESAERSSRSGAETRRLPCTLVQPVKRAAATAEMMAPPSQLRSSAPVSGERDPETAQALAESAKHRVVNENSERRMKAI